MPFNMFFAVPLKLLDKDLSLSPTAEKVLLNIPGSGGSGGSPFRFFAESRFDCVKFADKTPNIAVNTEVFVLV